MSQGFPSFRVRVAFCLLLVGFGIAGSPVPAKMGRDLRGVPVRSFGPADYDAHPQCWSLVQDPRGLIHVANTDGLLSYDGARWQLWSIASGSSATSVCVGPNEDVYVGATGQLGRLVADANGSQRFELLGQELEGPDVPLGDVWYAVATSREVYMASLTQIYRVDAAGSVERIDVRGGLELDGHYLALEIWNDTLWVAVDGRGLHRWNGGRFEQVTSRDPSLDPGDASVAFSANNLSEICAVDDLLYVIESDRIFRYDGTRLERFATEADSALDGAWVYAATGLCDQRLAVGTVESGVFAFDRAGKLLGHWDAQNGLLHDTVSDLVTDSEGGLWVCQESGLVRLDLQAPIELYSEITGLVSDVVEYEDRLYVSTSHGFFRLHESSGPDRRFEQIGQADDFTGMVLSADGFFVVSSAGIRSWNGTGWNESKLRVNYPSSPRVSRHFEHVLFVNSRDGLVAISTENGKLVELSTTAIPLEGQSLAEGDVGELWIGSREGAVVRVELDPQNFTALDIDAFGAAEGVPATPCWVAQAEGRIFLASGAGLLVQRDGRFVPVPSVGSAPSDLERLRNLDGSLWALAEGNVGRIGLDDGARAHWSWERAFSLHARTGRAYAYAIHDGSVFASQALRLVRWDLGAEPGESPLFRPILRRVIASSDSVLWDGTRNPDRLRFDHDDGSVRFEFAAATQRGETPPTYQSRLAGVDSDWSSWSSVPFRDYSNLREGSYTLHLRAMDAYGTTSDAVAIPIRVQPPWTRTIAARAAFALLTIFGVLLLGAIAFHLRSRQLRIQKRDLERMVEERTEQLAFANLELQSSNQELAHVNSELQRVDQQRSELLGIAAHDLKNPLSSIRMVAGALADELDPESSSRYLCTIIDEASERMLERIQGLLTSAAAEAGEISIELKECDVVALARNVIELQQPAAAAKQQTLTLNFDPLDLEQVWIRGDKARLHQAFENLVSNAIKYSPAVARITATVARTAANEIRLMVEDEGPGLAADELERLFRPFQRLSARPTASEDSCGLGLYIVKNVVEHHGGRVWVESSLGAGSRFGFDLPCSTPVSI